VADGQTAITKELHEAALVSTLVAFGRVGEAGPIIEELQANRK